MIKSIKKHFIFLFIALCAMNCAKTMEELASSSESRVKNEQAKQALKKTKLQKKRANRRKKKKCIKDESKSQIKVDSDRLVNLKSEADLEKLREASTLENINKLLGIPDKLEGLNFLANMLLMQSWLIKELKALSIHSKDLVDSALRHSACCFSISDDGKSMCGHDIGSCGTIMPLSSPNARSLALDLVAPIWLTDDLWHNPKLLNDFYWKSTKLVNDENEEISLIGNYVKNEIANHWLCNRIDSLWDKFIAELSDMEFNRSDLEGDIEIILFKDGVSNLIAKWLIQNKIYKATQVLLPNFMDIAKGICELKNFFDELWEEQNGFIGIKDAAKIHEDINKIILLYEKLEVGYQELYEIVLAPIIEQERFYRQIYLVPTINLLPKDLDVPLIECDFRDYDNEGEKTFAFIADIVSQTKTRPVKNSQVKVKKKSRRRRFNKKNTQEKEQEYTAESELLEKNKDFVENSHASKILEPCEPEFESVNLPNYAQRVLNWFDPEYVKEIAADADSILYHTYSPLADFFIEKHGIPIIQPNQTNPANNDLAYYMLGRIRHKNDQVEEVMFGICFGDGQCYHRGYNRIDEFDLSQQFEKSKTRYDFPDLSKKIIIDRQMVHVDRDDICKDIEYKETLFYIEIYDSVNEVTITLFKPTHF